jgi:hypothetical protein
MPPRNVFAVGALWTLGVTWLGLVATLVYAILRERDPAEGVLWTLLGIGTFGFVLTLAGITAIRTRGDTVVAIAALVLAVALAMTLNPVFFIGYGWGS